ncbi:unnamed protein product [Symbiodinium sp. CCMP2592]|nr:unnamed protein product [Symbiodinium sp. CCMP2592]
MMICSYHGDKILCGAASDPAKGCNKQVFSGDEVFPEYHLEGVSLGTDYVLQVRCHNEAGASEWSALSEPLRTPEPRPKDLGPPEALEAGLEFVTLRWTSSTIDVECYEILVEPQSSSEPSNLAAFNVFHVVT